MASMVFSAAMSMASCSGGVSRPMSGPAWPTWEVVKKTGSSIRSKSPSARIRSISTEPTMPLQPTIPILFI